MPFLEGVRNGQELGALLGYQFERALHDRYVIDGVALAQFILAFRKKYPLVADKITPDAANESIELKEAYQVVDGYALLEAVFLTKPAARVSVRRRRTAGRSGRAAPVSPS